jgi:hypothetical protein
MSYLIQIEQPQRLPFFVKCLHRDGSVSVTFKRARARRFPDQSAPLLERVRTVHAAWPGPVTAVFYTSAGL